MQSQEIGQSLLGKLFTFWKPSAQKIWEVFHVGRISIPVEIVLKQCPRTSVDRSTNICYRNWISMHASTFKKNHFLANSKNLLITLKATLLLISVLKCVSILRLRMTSFVRPEVSDLGSRWLQGSRGFNERWPSRQWMVAFNDVDSPFPDHLRVSFRGCPAYNFFWIRVNRRQRDLSLPRNSPAIETNTITPLSAAASLTHSSKASLSSAQCVMTSLVSS